MRDSQLNHAEWRWQRLFIMAPLAAALLLLAGDAQKDLPDRRPMPDRLAALRVEPVALRGKISGGATLTGAWELSADDSRFFGLSALAILPDGRLQAITDSGVLATFAVPGGSPQVLLNDLPAGPGYPTFKRFRDSEAMLVSADGRRRLIAFENRHSLWQYDARSGARAVPVSLPTSNWPKNKGIEAMVRDPANDALLLLHEGGRQVILIVGDSLHSQVLPLAGATGGVADAVRLPDDRMVVAVREIGLSGLTNRLAWLKREGGGYRLRNFASLPLGPLDNVEGLAAEQLPDGKTLLWAVTDSDGWRRTLLIRMTLDTTKAPADAGA